MARSKKPRKAYRPKARSADLPWWTIDDGKKVSAMNTDFALWAHYGLEQLKAGSISLDTVNSLGALLRLSRRLAPKMVEEKELTEIVSQAEAAMTEVLVAKREGKPYDMRYVQFVETGLPVALEIVKRCNLRELQQGLKMNRIDRDMLRMELKDEA